MSSAGSRMLRSLLRAAQAGRAAVKPQPAAGFASRRLASMPAASAALRARIPYGRGRQGGKEVGMGFASMEYSRLQKVEQLKKPRWPKQVVVVGEVR